MSQNPPKIVVTDSFYKIMLHKRAQDNERLLAQGLPPRTDELSYIAESDADALVADEAKRRAARASQKAAPRPTPPTRGPLCRAAKAKLTARCQSIPGFERHSRKCQICRHPDVDAIEQIYLNWHSADDVCNFFQLRDNDIVYRHARAAGLDVLRRQNTRLVVERFVEQWRHVKITLPGILRSIHALSCLDDKGRWTDPPRTHIILSSKDLPAATSAVAHLPLDAAPSASGLLENGVVSTTETTSTERSKPHDNDSSRSSVPISHASSAEDKKCSSDLEHPASSLETLET